MPREFAPAKVNLYLHVVGRRADGYHVLDSLAVFPDVGDWLDAEPDDGLSLTVTGPFASGLAAETDNLVLRAARALAAASGVAPRARLVLHKYLPVASGLGGGSADAAATLRLLTRLWGLDIPLAALAARLGADVPVCLASRAARMSGVGEVLGPAPALPPFGMVLVNPGVPVSTQAVFAARQAGFSVAPLLPDSWADARALAEGLADLSNDLEAPAVSLCPAITDVLAAIAASPGCLLTRMSGSGASCFGIFAAAAAARNAAAELCRQGWWCWSGSASWQPTRPESDSRVPCRAG